MCGPVEAGQTALVSGRFSSAIPHLIELCLGANDTALRLRTLFRGSSLSIGSAHDSHQLFDLASLLSLVSGVYRVLDAMSDMVLQDLFLQPPQRSPHCCNLRDDIDAVAVFLDHPGKPAYLPFYSVEPLCGLCLDVLTHARYIPLPGKGHNP